MEIKEIEIPVPWGQISAKLWGDASNQAIILVHGILDNVGTFDRLIPLLPPTFYYICIDLPGHGRSSHWPQYAVINTLDNLLAYKATVEHFKRGKYIFLCHSWGGQLSFVFAQMYPEHVIKIVMLDTLYLFPKPVSALKPELRNLHEAYFDTMRKLSKNQAPEYTYEEAIDRMINNRRYGALTQAAAEPLLKRMMIPTENGKLKFSLDQRIKFAFNPPIDFRYIADFVKKEPVLCPVLIILASESDVQRVYFKKLIKLYQMYKNVKIKIVEGNHDVHNVSPERVAPLIRKFLLHKKAKL